MADMFEFDISEFERYFDLVEQASKGLFKKEIAKWFEASGFEFLRIVQDEIIRREVVDTRLLLNSFEKGARENTWKVSDGGLTLEVGTNIKYAQYVNDGHWTNKRGVSTRFVPGEWRGDKFVYINGANTGMVLKQKWIEGAHYWESAIRVFERVFEASIEIKMQEWGDKYFSQG